MNIPALSIPERLRGNLTDQDQRKFIEFGRGVDAPLPFTKIHEAILVAAATHPELTAVEHLDRNITYAELADQSAVIANRLKGLGVRPGDNVGIFLERSIEMVVGILAALRLGATYIPQDARITPTTQLSHIAKVSNAKVILSMRHLRHRLPLTYGMECLCIDEVLADSSTDSTVFQPDVFKDKDPIAFILFTSGTTGMPNGVRVSHTNLCNILLTEPGGLGLMPGDRVAQILNISFDMSAWETLGTLSHGATLVIRGKSIQAVIPKVTHIIATPSILSTIDADANTHIKKIALAGEPCPKPLAEKWSKFADFYNCCGPTETTIINTMHLFKGDTGTLSIGGPTPNNTVYVLDDEMNPASIGEIGEMWAGGLCVSKGYLSNPKLTDERYKPDPFLGEGYFMFRTRDLGRWDDKGELEHFGRTDDQVKIKGFRIELDSISAALESTPSCDQAVTLKLDSQTLVAFTRPSGVDMDQAYKAVESLLPYYCMPKMIVTMDEFPMTPRGKINKRALTAKAVELLEQKNNEQSQLVGVGAC